jgi:alanine racemase
VGDLMLRVVAEVNLAAIERNVTLLRARLRPATAICAVVKANGYGHGAAPSARAAQAAGATTIAVATAGEAAELRAEGISGPLMVLGAVSDEELPLALEARAELVAWDERFVSTVARHQGLTGIHVKLDSGMGRLGTRDAEKALAIVGTVIAEPNLHLAGVTTHFATADDDADFVSRQLRAFEPFVSVVRDVAPDVVVHAANSGATLWHQASHFDMVRCGISIYGADPMNEDPHPLGLEPALALRSYVAAVKRIRTGESAGYGRRFIAERDGWLATVPIGYGDGFRRGLTNNCDVLIGGRRYPLVGTVSMDNITVDLGPSADVKIGDIATLIGSDGNERQTAEDLARRLDTINYEVLCGISARVPRHYHRDGKPIG